LKGEQTEREIVYKAAVKSQAKTQKQTAKKKESAGHGDGCEKKEQKLKQQVLQTGTAGNFGMGGSAARGKED